MEEFLKLFSVRDILLHIINTLILFVAITYFVYKPVRKFMNERAERISAQFDEIALQQASANQLMADAQAARAAAEAEAASTRADGAARAQQVADTATADAKQQAALILARATTEAAAQKEAAQADIGAQALEMAVEIAEKLIGRELSQKDNQVLAREFLTKVKVG